MKRITSFIPGLSRFVASATAIIILFIFSKFVPTEDLGLLNYFIAFITLIGVFTDFGLPEAIQRFLPQISGSNEEKARTISSTLFLEVFLVVLGAIVILFFDYLSNFQISKNYPLLLFFIIIFSSANVVLLVFNGLQERFRTSVYFLLTSLTFLGTTFALYFTGTADVITSFLVGRLVSWIIFFFFPLIDLYRRDLLVFEFKLSRRFFKFAFNSFVVIFSYNTFNQWDSILVVNVLGEFQNGIYKTVAFLASVPYVISVILQTKLLPEYSSLIHQGNKQQVKKSFIFFTKILSLFGIIIILASIPLAYFGINLFYSEQIATLGYMYFSPILAAVMIYIAAVPAVSVLMADGEEHIVRNISLVQSIGFVALSTILLPIGGLTILPILLIILNAIFLLVNLLYVRKRFA